MRKQSSPPRAASLLKWYDENARTMPWRFRHYRDADPYKVWVSEIMLQQTTVKTVIPYFERFIQRFPTVKSLAQAPRDDVLYYWAGLGYYRRARHLHEAAKILARCSAFPKNLKTLLKLPGIGDYTARAIAAIAFNEAYVPIDGNVKRITARLFAVEEPLTAKSSKIDKLASDLNKEPCAQRRASDFAQALFDLGATICRSPQPLCCGCPWSDACLAYRSGNPAQFPKKLPKKTSPKRYRLSFLAIDPNGNFLAYQRNEKELLGGMYDLPSSVPTARHKVDKTIIARHAPFEASWKKAGTIKHVFTHFTLNAELYVCLVTKAFLQRQHNGPYDVINETSGAPLSTLTRKCVEKGKSFLTQTKA